MTDRDALYRAILDRPDDDTLRLVFADALEESGDPQRAAFIRAQVELAQLPDYDPRAVQVRYHERTFDHRWALEFELPDGFDWAREPFRRGMPGAVQARDGAAFVAHADELFAQYPIEALELALLRVAETKELAECPWLERITSLSLVQGASGAVVTRLLASPLFTRLTELRIGSEFSTPPAVSAVVRSRVFRQLTSLAVRSDRRAGGNLAGELTRLGKPPRLKKLDLSANRLTAATITQLIESPAAESVEELDLSDNTLRSEGVAAIAGGALPNLRALHLLRTRPEEEGVAALASAPLFRELRSLSLGGNNLGPTAATAVAHAPADQLRVLDLHDNRIGDRGAVTLAGSPHLANLVLLDLAEAQVGDSGAEALAESPHLDGLIYLNVYGNPITDRGVDLLRERFGARVYPYGES
jgi:uncharacterized protein (TIGR02996 family)